MTSPNRRDVLRRAGTAVGAGAIFGLAGCSGDGGDGSGDGGDGGDGGTATTPSDMEPFKLGVLEPLSGPIAISGQEAVNGSQLTVDQINENGGLNGREIQLLSQDTEASPETAVDRARQLIQQDNVDALHGIVSSAVAKAVVEFTKTQQVPIIGTATQTPDIVKEQCSRYTFRTTTNLIHQQRATAKMVADNLYGSGEDVAIAGVEPDYVYGQQSWSVFKDVYENELNSAVEYVNEAFPAFLKGEYEQEIQATLDANPDVVHSSLYSGDLIAFIRQAQQFDFFEQIEAFIAGVVPIEVMVSLGPESTPDGLWSCVSVAPQWPENNQIHASFTEDYRNRFDEPSMGEPTGFSYENAKAVRAYEKAAAEAGSTNVEDMIDAMEGMRLDNAPAPPATIRAGDHQAIVDEYLTGPIGPVEGYDYHAFTEFQPVSADFIADEEECENI